MDSPKPEPATFYGSKKPWYKLKKETPLHIAAAHLAATGASHRKIYTELGKSESWMTNLARQPFFQVRVDSILREKNRAALESMFKIQRLSNPAALVELGDGAGDARIARARDILDRAFRKKESTSPDPERKRDSRKGALAAGKR